MVKREKRNIVSPSLHEVTQASLSPLPMNLVKLFNDNPNEDLLLRSANWLPAGQSVMMGIDEAGRGPVLGPMVYAAAFYPVKLAECMIEKHFADSKTLTEEQREYMFARIEKDKNISWVAKIISPNTISKSSFKRIKYNLNELSHDAATLLADKVLETDIKIEKLYVDTVGPADKYQAKLVGRLKRIKEITVESKADASFAVVSAASIVAKVLRDACLKNWKFPEDEDFLGIRGLPFGCGYPSDSVTTAFLRKCFNPIFGFPTFIRFNWSTASNILDDKGYSIELQPTQNPFDASKSESGKRKASSSSPSTPSIMHFFGPLAKKKKVDKIDSKAGQLIRQQFCLTAVNSLRDL